MMCCLLYHTATVLITAPLGVHTGQVTVSESLNAIVACQTLRLVSFGEVAVKV
jgi:hypothetical protein